MLDAGASDLHLTAGAPALIRVNGDLAPMRDCPQLPPDLIQRLIYTVLTQKQRERFEQDLELDFAYAMPGAARFRVNVYRQRENVGAAFRRIPYEIKSLEDLGVPASVSTFASMPRGMVLVTGPTGSGKSTTLASLIDLANRTRRDHIMTVEDPIEFLHRHKSCMVNQREVGEDTHSFANALKHVLRQDPDDLDRADRRRDRPPRLRHPAHAGRRPDHRPRHRRLPAAPAAAGPGAAGRCVAGGRLPDPVPDGGRFRPGRRDRGDDRDSGDPQPHP
jgi:Tfp pilus assembly ATPase PilU